MLIILFLRLSPKCSGIGHRPKVHLLLEKIHSGDLNADFVANTKDASRAATHQPRMGRIEEKKIAVECGDMHEPAQEKVRQLDEQPVVAHFQHAGRKDVTAIT